MSDEKKVYVDFAFLCPFGRISDTAGPFTVKESEQFVERMKKLHGTMLLNADVREELQLG